MVEENIHLSILDPVLKATHDHSDIKFPEQGMASNPPDITFHVILDSKS